MKFRAVSFGFVLAWSLVLGCGVPSEEDGSTGQNSKALGSLSGPGPTARAQCTSWAEDHDCLTRCQGLGETLYYVGSPGDDWHYVPYGHCTDKAADYCYGRGRYPGHACWGHR